MNVVSQLVGNFANNMTEHGCSVFFFTSAIQSGIFGEMGRHNQAKLVEGNLEFRERLQGIKDEFQREHLDSQLQFRRESYELSRQYMLQQSAQINENRQKEIEFQIFLDNYWPLEYSPYSVIKEQKQLLRRSIVPLRVIIAKTEVSKFLRNDPKSYGEFCRRISSDLRQLSYVNVENRPWKKDLFSNVCDAMNINYIMQGIPTLILFPYQIGNMFGIEISSWAFGGGNRSMLQSKILQIDEFAATKSLEETYSAMRAIIGMIRDAYMLSEYRMPVCYPSLTQNDTSLLPEIRKMLVNHYEKLYELVINSDSYRLLCTESEINNINKSFETIKLIGG